MNIEQPKSTISDVAQKALTLFDTKKFSHSPTIHDSSTPPYVETHILEQIYALDDRFTIEWEMQFGGYYRWHIKRYRSDGRLDEPLHVLLLQNPELADPGRGKYVPLDQRAVNRLTKILEWSNDPVKFAQEWQIETEIAQDANDQADDEEIEAWARYYRRAFARIKDDTPDTRWETGISKQKDGSYITGPGAGDRRLTKAL